MFSQQTAAIVLGLYVVICGIILYFSVKEKGTAGEEGISRETLGGARFTWPLIAATVAATMLGPADALGLSKNGYDYGMVWALAPLGAACAQILSGLFLVHRVKAQPGNPQTIGDVFALRFGESARVPVGLVLVVQAIAFAGVLVLAGAQILENFVGIPLLYGLISFALVIGTYTAFGGLATIVKTDFVQSIIIAIMLVVVFGTTVTLLARAPSFWDALPVTTAQFHTEYTWVAMLAVAATYFLGELMLPVYSQRALVARTGHHARVGFIVAGMFAVVWYIVVTASGVASQTLSNGDGEFVLLANLRAVFGATGPWATAAMILALISLLSLTHSTFDAILNIGGTAFARDLMAGPLGIETSAEQGAIARRAMLGIAALGMVIPFLWGDLIEILIVGYTVWAPTLMPIFLWMVLTEPRRYPAIVFWIPALLGVAGWFAIEHGLSLFGLQSYVPAVLVGAMLNAVAIWYLGRKHKGAATPLPAADTVAE